MQPNQSDPSRVTWQPPEWGYGQFRSISYCPKQDDYFLKYFFLLNPTNPIKPDPRRSNVGGTGTTVVSVPPVGLVVLRAISSSVKSLPERAVFWLNRDTLTNVFDPEFHFA